MRERRLNLGCGKDTREGWTNLDHLPGEGVDVVHDLNEYPWPFETDSFDHVLADNVLEHLDQPDRAIHELHRITKPGGRIVIVVPHYKNRHALQPAHRTLWSRHSLEPYYQDHEKAGLDATPLFELETLKVTHQHPFAWHQRKYLGRELIGWTPSDITWVLRNRAPATSSVMHAEDPGRSVPPGPADGKTAEV